MIIVYYDSYVQIFFEEFVKFVSVSWNMMCKVKMVVKVVQIKWLVEFDMFDDDDEDEKKDGVGNDLILVVGDGVIVVVFVFFNVDVEVILVF